MKEYIGLVPPKEGFVQTEKFNFARFAEGPNYKKVNRDLLERVLNCLPVQSVAVDVATGHGMVPRISSDLLAGTNKRLYMIGVDLDPFAIEQAKAQIHNTGEVGFVFIQGDARNLENLLKDHVQAGEVNYTSIHDAIHEIRDDRTKVEIIDSMEKMLRPGGLFSYNSAFTKDAVGREWAYWLIEFMATESMKDAGARPYKGEVDRLPIHSPSFYRALIENSGLTVIEDNLVEVHLSLDELKAISEYPPFIRGFTEALAFTRPVTLREASQAMKEAIPATLKRAEILKKSDGHSLIRKWHEITAQKAA